MTTRCGSLGARCRLVERRAVGSLCRLPVARVLVNLADVPLDLATLSRFEERGEAAEVVERGIVGVRILRAIPAWRK